MAVKMRLMITKGREIQFISHLDYARAIERALRRAKIPVAYSEGFNPHIKMSFASALAVGVTSEAELIDVECSDLVNNSQFSLALKGELPAGIELKRVKEVPIMGASLAAKINLATYTVTASLLSEAALNNLIDSLERFNNELQVVYRKQSPKGSRDIDIKQYLAKAVTADIDGDNMVIKLHIRITPTGSVKPIDIITVLADRFNLPVIQESILIHRTGLYIIEQGSTISPLDMTS